MTSEQEMYYLMSRPYDPGNDVGLQQLREQNAEIRSRERTALLQCLGAACVYILKHPDESDEHIALLRTIERLLKQKKE